MKQRILTGADDDSEEEMTSQDIYSEERVKKRSPPEVEGHGVVNTEEEEPPLKIEGLAWLDGRKSSEEPPLDGLY